MGENNSGHEQKDGKMENFNTWLRDAGNASIAAAVVAFKRLRLLVSGASALVNARANY